MSSSYCTKCGQWSQEHMKTASEVKELILENAALKKDLAATNIFSVKVSLSDGSRDDDEKGKPNKIFHHPFDYSAMIKFTQEYPWQFYKISIRRSPFDIDCSMIVSGSALQYEDYDLLKDVIHHLFHEAVGLFLEVT